MSENNKNIARQFIRDVFNQHQVVVLESLLTNDFEYSSELIKEHKDKAWFMDMLEQIFTAIPDFRASISDLNELQGLITIKLQLSGSLQNDFMGIAAHNQPFSGPGIMVLHIQGNCILQIQAKFKTQDYLAQFRKQPTV